MNNKDRDESRTDNPRRQRERKEQSCISFLFLILQFPPSMDPNGHYSEDEVTDILVDNFVTHCIKNSKIEGLLFVIIALCIYLRANRALYESI